MKVSLAMAVVLISVSLSWAGVSRGDTIILKHNDGTTTFLVRGVEQDTIPELYAEDAEPELYCLALNIYHESRSDNLAGQAAVADVVLNRVNDKRYPDTICGVIKEGPLSKWWKETEGKEVPVRHRCQFSWWCDGKSDTPKQPKSWRKAQEIAYHIVNSDLFRGISEGSTHYHATYVDPHWNKSMIEIGRIGEHIFYKSLPK